MKDCGSCHECCKDTLKTVVDGEDLCASGECKNLGKSGCSIYESRPSMCSQYECGWRLNDMPIWMRPDKSGVIVNVMTEDVIYFKDQMVPYVVPTGKTIPERVLNYLVSLGRPFRFVQEKGDQVSIGVYGDEALKIHVKELGATWH